MRVTSLWGTDSTSPLHQKVGVKYHAKIDERVIQNLEKGLLLAKQREELVKQRKLDGRYLAKLQILTDSGAGRGAYCVKVFLPQIPEELLVERQPEQEPGGFDDLGSLFG